MKSFTFIITTGYELYLKSNTHKTVLCIVIDWLAQATLSDYISDTYLLFIVTNCTQHWPNILYFPSGTFWKTGM